MHWYGNLFAYIHAVAASELLWWMCVYARFGDCVKEFRTKLYWKWCENWRNRLEKSDSIDQFFEAKTENWAANIIHKIHLLIQWTAPVRTVHSTHSPWSIVPFLGWVCLFACFLLLFSLEHSLQHAYTDNTNKCTLHIIISNMHAFDSYFFRCTKCPSVCVC